MFDFLDKIGLKAVLEAIKGKMPTSLPANGGNADTVNSLRIGSLYMDIFSTSLTNTHPCWNKICCVFGQSMDSSAENFVDNAPESGYDVIWYEVSTIGTGNRAYQIAHGCYSNQRKSFIRYMHDGVWSGWYNVADGGNADTVDGYHVDNLIHASGSIPPEYITEFLRINADTKSIERWNTGNLKVAFANNAAKAENADTVDGLHANDFSQIVDFGGSETDTKTAIGKPGKTAIYRCSNWTDYPAEFIDGQGILIAVNYNGSGTVGTDFIWCTQIIVNPRQGNRIYVRYIDSTSVLDWKEISATPIKSTGQIISPTDQYGTIILPNSSTRRYLSITAVGCYAEMLLFNNEYVVHIKNGNYEAIINAPVTYIAFYIE